LSTDQQKGRGIRKSMRNWLRSAIYPGLDLHTRNRSLLCRFWKNGPRDVLDAGCGNGYFSWLAYKSGARVLALNIDASQVKKAREFLLDFKKSDPLRLQFEIRNLYDLANESRTFDEIICFEVLEHLHRDKDVAQQFYRILRPGGALHVCCPYRLHPRHQSEVTDTEEIGGHVRQGYSEADYRALLEPIGFQILDVVGIGSTGIYHADRLLRIIRTRVGDWLALPLFPFTLPFIWTARFNVSVPFSLYVRAIKPSDLP
jgi:2-polyprenyl-3-methyl-5-hydroxy-6-metoxy-1,4-benzoquinol methylase